MFLKKLLATVATVTLTAGALLGVSAPAFADESTPASDPAVTNSDTAVPDPDDGSHESISTPAPEQPEPVTSELAAPAGAQAEDSERSAERSAERSTQPEEQALSPEGDKVWVCQFVSSDSAPLGFHLAPGDQPVHLSGGELGDGVNDSGTFVAGQPSFIVASDDASLCSRTEVIVDEEVRCPTYQYGGIVNIATATKLFYGSTQVGFTQSHSTRKLTAEELRACDPPPEEEPLVATAQADFAAATCDAPERLILGPIVNATWGEITDPEGPNDYSVTATANAGAYFSVVGPALRAAVGVTTLTFSGVLNPQHDPLDPRCDLATLGLVMPAVSFSQASCGSVGIYSLGVAPGYDPSLVSFTVNGVSGVRPGIYPVAASASVSVSAQAVAPNGLEFDWVDPPEFSFVVSGNDDCTIGGVVTAQLPTLAYTGSGGISVAWWLLPTSLIVLGAAACFVRRRMDAGAQ